MNLPTFAFYERLSPRERVLTLIVAGAVFLVINLVVLRGLTTSFRNLAAQRKQKSFEAETLRMYVAEKPRWAQRMKWLHDKQPPLVNRDVAGVKLEDQVKAVADQNKVILTNHQILPAPVGALAQNAGDYQALTVQLQARGDWTGMIKFLAALQRPENFLAFESASLHTDPSDSKVMTGQFRVAKWFAPAAGR